MFCGECVRCCTTQAGIRLTQEYELSGFDRAEMVEVVEKELVPCELCERPIGPRDHLLWIYRKLGSLAYANVTVSLAAQDALGLRERVPRDDRPLDRADIQRVLCPACRRIGHPPGRVGPRLMPRGEDPRAALPPLLARRWLLVGIGNDLRGDDAFGPLLARRLRARGLPAIDAGMAPENVTGPIRRAAPEVLLLADATDLGEPVGTVRLLGAEELAEGGTSTHDPSLTMLLAYLEAESEHPLEVRFLAAQAGTRALGAAPSPALAAALAPLAALFPAPE